MLRFLVTLVTLCVATPVLAQQPQPNELRINIDVEDADLVDVMYQISEQAKRSCSELRAMRQDLLTLRSCVSAAETQRKLVLALPKKSWQVTCLCPSS